MPVVRPRPLGLGNVGPVLDGGVPLELPPVVPPEAAPRVVPLPEPVARVGPAVVPESDPGAPFASELRFPDRRPSDCVPLGVGSVVLGEPVRSTALGPPGATTGRGCCCRSVGDPDGMPVPSRGAAPRVGAVEELCCARTGAASAAAAADAITRWEKGFMGSRLRKVDATLRANEEVTDVPHRKASSTSIGGGLRTACAW
jgi:hypothetical protein